MKAVQNKKTAVLAVLAVLTIAVLFGAQFTGMERVPLSSLFHPSPGAASEILWRLRMPRVFTSFLAGAGLAVSGMVFQAMFRNPLATPFTLGVSSGAALGAALSIRLGITFTLLGISSSSLFAFIGALASITLVYGITRAKRGFSTSTMLLAGVAISLFFSSVILFTQYLSDFTNSLRILRWLMGGLAVVGFKPVQSMLPLVVGGSAVIFYLTNELDLMTTGTEIALSRGVDVKRTKTILFLVTSLMVGGVVSVCGPIGFVGMMAPHICRLLIGPGHRHLTPATILFGGSFLTLCDTLSRTIIAPAEVPVGVVTALLGGPFFIWLLMGGLSERSVLSYYEEG
ncbi:MAG: FecCD family ABC transporter permease [Thermodesulfobacteriota bacterium]